MDAMDGNRLPVEPPGCRSSDYGSRKECLHKRWRKAAGGAVQASPKVDRVVTWFAALTVLATALDAKIHPAVVQRNSTLPDCATAYLQVARALFCRDGWHAILL
jgi:hypothetical protein